MMSLTACHLSLDICKAKETERLLWQDPTYTHTHTHTNIYTQETERLLWQDPRRLALKFNHEADNTLISEYVREAFFMSLLPSNLVPFLHLQLLVTCRWQMLHPGRCARLVSVVWHCRLCKHGNPDYSHL